MDHHPVNLFGGTISTLSRSLDLRARKHETVLNNVANADTPNYKPFVMDVEAAIQKEPQAVVPGTMQLTNERHLPGRPSPDDPETARTADGENPLLFRGDQNGVDIDAEMTALAKNSLLYRASAQMVKSKLSGLKNVIKGGSQ
ncbi:flagellar basal body rod protein FlgB [uncultured Desulfosarcina sp.]|uniref:flagellar basal body rod protein FlgB n=1 Tax=uncultured Desulfosarcina sp. TaxID=218289 RepID=UPI0029C7FDD7|nr:flagellar basal body rod protein FlgB [uncultured Desulfosarcina sp.]